VFEKLVRLKELLERLESATSPHSDEVQLIVSTIRQHATELEAVIRSILGCLRVRAERSAADLLMSAFHPRQTLGGVVA